MKAFSNGFAVARNDSDILNFCPGWNVLQIGGWSLVYDSNQHIISSTNKGGVLLF